MFTFLTETKTKFKYNHYEEPENRELKLYDYFDNDDSNFYLGKTTSLIDVYQSTKNKDDFRYVLKDDELVVTELEELLMHLQRQLADLDSVILDQNRRIDGQQRQIERMTAELRTVEAAAEATRNLEDEKPPHY